MNKPEKVVIPKFVADWIDKCKFYNKSPRDAMSSVGLSYKIDDWMLDKGFNVFTNQEKFMKAWLDGYEVEKIPKFRAKSRLSEMDNWGNGKEDYFNTSSDLSSELVWLGQRFGVVSLTRDEWTKRGITDDLAIFEEVDE